MNKGIITILMAVLICCSPAWLVYEVAGKEGLGCFLRIVAGFGTLIALYAIAHWAIETVLVAIGLDRARINTDNGGPRIIFWKQ